MLFAIRITKPELANFAKGEAGLLVLDDFQRENMKSVLSTNGSMRSYLEKKKVISAVALHRRKEWGDIHGRGCDRRVHERHCEYSQILGPDTKKPLDSICAISNGSTTFFKLLIMVIITI